MMFSRLLIYFSTSSFTNTFVKQILPLISLDPTIVYSLDIFSTEEREVIKAALLNCQIGEYLF